MAGHGQTALEKAMEVAKLLASFPQTNLRNDRLSVYANYDWGRMLKTETDYGIDTLKWKMPEVKKFISKL
jgi:hypothetical protein